MLSRDAAIDVVYRCMSLMLSRDGVFDAV